jgi:hypothetical protein
MYRFIPRGTVMKRTILSLSAIVLIFLTACGGGGGAEVTNPGGGSTLVGADFTPDNNNPGSGTASMQKRSASSNLATVNVGITGVDNLYAASFDVVYDPAKVEYSGYSAGTILESGGHTPRYDVQDTGQGRLVVVAQRIGAVPGVDVTSTQPLIRLTFRVSEIGVSRLDFENANLTDDQIPPQNIAGISWSGGTISGV